MRYLSMALAALTLGVPAMGQVVPGDILVIREHGPVHHLRNDGALVRTVDLAGHRWGGGSFLPEGDILIARRQPTSGFVILDGDTGAVRSSVDVTIPSLARIESIERLRDGTFLMLLRGSDAIRVDGNGTQLAAFFVGNVDSGDGSAIDRDHNVWLAVSNGWSRFDQEGRLIDQFTLGPLTGDLDVAQDGTVWITDRWGGRAVHYTADGALLGEIPILPFWGPTSNLALDRDGTILAASMGSPTLERFAQDGTILESIPLPPHSMTVAFTEAIDIAGGDGTIGTAECEAAVPGSDGLAGWIRATGSSVISDGSFRLRATTLPAANFGLFLSSRTPDFVPNARGSVGTLCLGGPVGLHRGVVALSDANGVIDRAIDLTQLPTSTGVISAMPGETWRFQLWYRDRNPVPTSNFTSVVAVALR